MFDVTNSAGDPTSTWIKAEPPIAAVEGRLRGLPDELREVARAVMQEMLEAEMTDTIGAGKSCGHAFSASAISVTNK